MNARRCDAIASVLYLLTSLRYMDSANLGLFFLFCPSVFRSILWTYVLTAHQVPIRDMLCWLVQTKVGVVEGLVVWERGGGLASRPSSAEFWPTSHLCLLFAGYGGCPRCPTSTSTSISIMLP